MKYLLITLLLSGCGIGQQVSEHCGGDLEMICETIVGNNDKDTEQDERLDVLEQQINANLVIMQDMISDINLIENQLTTLDESSEVAALQQTLNTLNQTVVSLGSSVATMSTSLTTVTNRPYVVAFVDPCGDLAGHYDEVIIKMSNGDLIAYFESGNKRFLTKLLPNTSYQTTDQQACNFNSNSL